MSNNTATILVVDDNPATRYSTSRVLRGAGFSVVEAETGQEALDKAITGVDMLVLDVNLPDIDGYTICRTLRGNRATARMPIVHLSASFVTADHKVTGLEAGADGYLTHPIEPPVLIATVNAFLRTRQAEIELQISEARFKAVFDNALTGVALFNEQLTYVDANPKLCELIGLDRTEIVGRRFMDLVPASHQVDVEKILDVLKTDLAWFGTFPLQSAIGTLVQLEWHISIHSEPGLRLAILTDISQRIRYESERESLLQSERTARADAERANTLKDDFLATLSHELRTPLNAIVGWSQVLQLGNLSAKDSAEGVGAIERNARALAQMISDLLDVSRITSGKLRLDIQMLDPAAVVESALTAILPTADAKSIRVTKALDPHCGPISGDPSRLQQVIWNLINNAVKFTPKGGRVHVTLQRVNSHIEICVADNGEGILESLLPQVFERFRQGDASSTREHGGLGLGLAIAKQMVELHDGTISAASAGLGKGATFSVSLPIMASHQRSESPGASAAQDIETNHVPLNINLAGLRVLVVEDDKDSRAMLRRLIVETGADVIEASDVDTALSQLNEFKPAVLVSDLGMPGRDGFELIHEVRQRGFTFQQLPSIALTAFARPEDRRRALLAGFQVHLTKPVDPHELIAAIASLVGQTGR